MCILGAFLIIALTGCEKDDLVQPEVKNNQIEDTASTLKSSTYYSLSVPHLLQVPPGDWNNTKNCGQTCVVMLRDHFDYYYSGSSSQITAQNTWLACNTGDSRFVADANGYYTTQQNLKDLLYYNHSLYSQIKWASSIYSMLAYIEAGKPCLAYVRTNMGTTSSSPEHWVLVVGRSGSNVIVNDPGSSSGNHKSYPFSTFVASWTSHSRAWLYMPVYNYPF